jgi:hypothetical protein
MYRVGAPTLFTNVVGFQPSFAAVTSIRTEKAGVPTSKNRFAPELLSLATYEVRSVSVSS